MSTIIRPELSTRSRYWIEKHRYYELKHFCLQYPIWKKARSALDGFSKMPINSIPISKTNLISSPTEKCAEARLFYSDRIDMVEKIAKETDDNRAMGSANLCITSCPAVWHHKFDSNRQC